MAITLPGYLEDVMGMVGLPWPDINEDDLNDLASSLRSWGGQLRDHRETAGNHLQQAGSAISAQSYESLVEHWGSLSRGHMEDVIRVTEDIADGMVIAADAVIAIKTAVIAAFVALAAETAADAAAAVMTFGLAATAEPALIAATRAIVKNLLQRIEQEVISKLTSEVFGSVIADLEHYVDNLVYAGVTQLAS